MGGTSEKVIRPTTSGGGPAPGPDRRHGRRPADAACRRAARKPGGPRPDRGHERHEREARRSPARGPVRRRRNRARGQGAAQGVGAPAAGGEQGSAQAVLRGTRGTRETAGCGRDEDRGGRLRRLRVHHPHRQRAGPADQGLDDRLRQHPVQPDRERRLPRLPRGADDLRRLRPARRFGVVPGQRRHRYAAAGALPARRLLRPLLQRRYGGRLRQRSTDRDTHGARRLLRRPALPRRDRRQRRDARRGRHPHRQRRGERPLHLRPRAVAGGLRLLLELLLVDAQRGQQRLHGDLPRPPGTRVRDRRRVGPRPARRPVRLRLRSPLAPGHGPVVPHVQRGT